MQYLLRAEATRCSNTTNVSSCRLTGKTSRANNVCLSCLAYTPRTTLEINYLIPHKGLTNMILLQPDSESTICDETTCPRYFSYFNRRHHCRRCGNIFCDAHSPYTVPLDQDANYHPKGTRSRSCEHCYLDYRRWAIARSSRSNSETSEEPMTPVVDCKGRGALGGIFAKGGMAESVAQSVPRDWHWSTF